MNMQSIFGLKCVVILLFVLFIGVNQGYSRDPVVIGTSNRSDATAHNNARKIVRTSDDRRFVVFQDSIEGQSVVKWTYSDDGFQWSEPQILANGSFPAAAVSKDDWIYVVWSSDEKEWARYGKYLEEGSLDWQDGNVAIGMYPSIDATEEYVHIVEQPISDTSRIAYIRCDQHLKYLDNCFIDDDTLISERPSIAGNIEYNGNYIHILWTNFWDDYQQSHIIHTYFNEYFWWNLSEYFKQDTLFYSNQCVYPSFSLRSYGNMGDFIIVGSSQLNNSGMHLTYAGYYWEDEFDNFSYQTSYETTGMSSPSVDDLGPHDMTCTIIWQDSGEIVYGQTDFIDFYDESILRISETNGQKKMHPSVCYKTFRADSFDVVWTEGDEPPYTIMYYRTFKWPPNIIITPDTIHTGTYKKLYYREVSTIGSIYPCYWNLLSGRFPEGIEVYYGGYSTELWGPPTESGDFMFTLSVTDSHEPAQSDTVTYHLTIHNSSPQLFSPDSISVEVGNNLQYVAQASDAEENEIEYSFNAYPSWLTPDAATISGTVPLNAIDTSFMVIASDGDMSDNMKVKVCVQGQSQIKLGKSDRLPKMYSLSQNYPNPFNAITTITYTLPQHAILDISVYDINGQLVQTLIKGRESVGNHEIVWDATNISSGVYFIQMRTGRFTQFKKCTLLK